MISSLVHVLTLLAAGALALDEEQAELARMVRENCVDEIGVDEGLLAKVDDGADLMPDPKLKCYLKCTMEMAGMISDGVVDVEAVLGLLPDDVKLRTTDIVRACDTQKGADDCDTAFLTQTCWQQANRADYIFI
ncbi:general odorant-binding protein 69a [Manduca sexta]|uniref:Antennal binding protein X n=1 Tax=Manduca sexta TaxID=7130 RepID=Q9U513_MANSE|nr:general odorant-binding protein 69a [Manduca sexta]AAF16697.1 antennal binding protein X [Manduca sexta]